MHIDREDIIKLIEGGITVEEYAQKYDMTIEHVKNFKKLYLMIEKAQNVI